MKRLRRPILRKGKALEGMRQAGKVAADILLATCAQVEEGMSGKAIDAIARKTIADYGAKSVFLGYRGYPAYACVSINEEVIHGIGGERCVVDGDLLSIDIGIEYGGWVGDNALTFPIGKISAEDLKLLQVTEDALDAAVCFARHGAKMGDLGNAVEQIVLEGGCSVVRDFVGHGVGRSIHEEPSVPNYGIPGQGLKLQEGMVLAIEPMVNRGKAPVKILSDGWTVVTKDESRSAHMEFTVAVGQEKGEVLTPRPRLTNAMGLNDLRPWERK